MRGIVVLAGSSHPELAQSIMSRLGLPLGGLKLAKFANSEISVEIGQSVRDQDVYIIQTSHGEVNDYLMEALILVHACKIASAARVTLVMPCFPYSRHVPCPVEKPHMEPLTAHQEGLLSLFRASPDHSVKGYRTWAGRSGRLVASMIEISGRIAASELPIAESTTRSGSCDHGGFARSPVSRLLLRPHGQSVS